ncbi:MULTISPECIES: CaiB/BaiF CoA transferase family protein [Alphaproteobacteria]|uniref:CoA transferase n=2 Tax=Alphaproteobacteria TaxID=28211 RepID=A0A512HNN3_9HYPH|nr:MULTISPECIES: CoA transferase [Alphaproteobacteria]GEO87054.1 CoA transferase [Ciceribacter naphthalenivorans]GLR23160.1 CoA transferase [Ciceribacter naphthalenivorans]GLT06016.1 CoA transferase [Sphingomonas psychrolutea]
MSKGIFDGLKVADFTWAAAGPIVTKQLSDNGATVVKVESFKHPDSIRLGGPFIDDKPGINRSGFFADFHSSKLGIGVDMNHADAMTIIRPMIEWADIVAESFRPGIMKKWGLDYESLRKINPRIIMLSSSLYGADGPWSRHPGYGAQGAALAGIQHMTGWPDRLPAVPKGAYSDSVSPRYALAALMAALIHREKTGEGQHVELSQIEATTQLVSPQLLDLQITGANAQRSGNRKEGSILHGVYPCAGTEHWIALEVEDEKQWVSLKRILGDGSDLDRARAEGADILDAHVGELTVAFDAAELMQACAEAGVPAGVAYCGSDLLSDPILEARNHFWPLSHAEMGTLKYNGPAYRFDKTPSALRSAAPRLGEHTDQVLTDYLGFTSNDLTRFRESGLLL